jgi:hypothetical protein
MTETLLLTVLALLAVWGVRWWIRRVEAECATLENETRLREWYRKRDRDDRR